MEEKIEMRKTLFEPCDENATAELARHVANFVYGSLVILLEGELGAGKTFFVRALAGKLGYRGAKSPSFTLVHEYHSPRTPLTLLHADFYRLGQEEAELLGAELEQQCNEDCFAAIEWAQRWKNPPTSDCWSICFETLTYLDHRRIEFSSRGRHAAKIFDQAIDSLPKSLKNLIKYPRDALNECGVPEESGDLPC